MFIVLGGANVGKSTLVNVLAPALAQFRPTSRRAKRRKVKKHIINKLESLKATASPLPGTTLSCTKFPCFPGRSYLFDTPGLFVQRQRDFLPPECAEFSVIRPRPAAINDIQLSPKEYNVLRDQGAVFVNVNGLFELEVRSSQKLPFRGEPIRCKIMWVSRHPVLEPAFTHRTHSRPSLCGRKALINDDNDNDDNKNNIKNNSNNNSSDSSNDKINADKGPKSNDDDDNDGSGYENENNSDGEKEQASKPWVGYTMKRIRNIT